MFRNVLYGFLIEIKASFSFLQFKYARHIKNNFKNVWLQPKKFSLKTREIQDAWA